MTIAAETLALARHVIGYFIAGMPAPVVTTLLPTDQIPHLLGGAAGPMMFPRAAIVGAPLSVGPGEEMPLLCDAGQRPRRPANADLPTRLGWPAPAPVALRPIANPTNPSTGAATRNRCDSNAAAGGHRLS